jgi:DNA-binding response OmpR family regulator
VSAWFTVPPRILFVDDEVSMSRATGRLLARMGFDVVTAESPLAALALAHDETIDVVVADIHLPNFSGVELAHELRASGLRAPILFISGDANALADAEAAGLERTRVLPKPFTAGQLNTIIWETITGEQQLESGIA